LGGEAISAAGPLVAADFVSVDVVSVDFVAVDSSLLICLGPLPCLRGDIRTLLNSLIPEFSASAIRQL
jgi:hypothetical protein